MKYPEWLKELSEELLGMERTYPVSMRHLFTGFQSSIDADLTRHQREQAKLNKYVQPSLLDHISPDEGTER